jgi:hypothetical protein
MWFSDFTLPGQCIGVSSLPNGVYYLLNTVNPLKIFYESNTNNNDAWVSFELIGVFPNRKIRVISHSPCLQLPGLCGELAPSTNLNGNIPGGQLNHP